MITAALPEKHPSGAGRLTTLRDLLRDRPLSGDFDSSGLGEREHQLEHPIVVRRVDLVDVDVLGQSETALEAPVADLGDMFLGVLVLQGSLTLDR